MGANRGDVLAALGLREEPRALTEPLIKRVLKTPAPRRYTLGDKSLRGFFVWVGAGRPGKKGKMVAGPASFWVQAKVNGKVEQARIGRADLLPLSEARQLARAMLNRLHAGEDPTAQKRAAAKVEQARISVRKYVEGDYWKKHLKNRRSGDTEKDRLTTVYGAMLDLRFDELTAEAINDALQARRDAGFAAGTILRDWTSFRAMLGQAKAAGLLPTLPFDRTRPPALQGLQGKRRVRWIGQHDPKELQRFEKALADEFADVRTALLLLATTGMRRGELIGEVYGKEKDKTFRQVPGLRRSEVNLKEGVAIIPAERSKSGKERRVYLNSEAVKMLRGLKVEGINGLYFPGKIHGWRQRLKKAMERIRTAMGTDDFRLHDLRHHYATRLRQSGAPLEIVRDALGHSDIKSTQIYSHIGPAEVKDAVAKVKL